MCPAWFMNWIFADRIKPLLPFHTHYLAIVLTARYVLIFVTCQTLLAEDLAANNLCARA